MFIKPRSKHKQFKLKFHEEFDKCKHIKSTIEKFDINDVDKAFYEYIIEHKRKYDYSFVKCEFKLVFNVYEFSQSIPSELYSNKTLCF